MDLKQKIGFGPDIYSILFSTVYCKHAQAPFCRVHEEICTLCFM